MKCHVEIEQLTVPGPLPAAASYCLCFSVAQWRRRCFDGVSLSFPLALGVRDLHHVSLLFTAPIHPSFIALSEPHCFALI